MGRRTDIINDLYYGELDYPTRDTRVRAKITEDEKGWIERGKETTNFTQEEIVGLMVAYARENSKDFTDFIMAQRRLQILAGMGVEGIELESEEVTGNQFKDAEQ